MKITKNIILEYKQKAINLDPNLLGFGDIYGAHMFLMDYWGEAWQNPRIVPYGNLNISPAAMGLHYGQLLFEGMKAYHWEDGRLALFRPQENLKRLNRSATGLCIPTIDETFILKALKELIKIDACWIPKSFGTSLYIRPTIIATEPHLGVRPSNEYLFMIITSPVGPYYKEGFNPVKIFVEAKFSRAPQGGLGFTKAAANYAASLYATKAASEKGYTQLLWLDSSEHKYIEEVGSMNIFFVIDDELITPSLSDSILAGITRDSIIKMVKNNDWGYKVIERRLSLAEVLEAHKNGRLKEAFGSGTAAVISPVGTLHYQGEDFTIADGKSGSLTKRLFNELVGIQYGQKNDTYNWVEIV